MFRNLVGMVILAMLILLNGCGSPKSDEHVGNIDKGEYYWSEGPVKVINLASEKEFLEESKLAVHWESGLILSGDAVWKFIAATNEANERKQYYLYYSITEEKWNLLDAGAGTTKDGRSYDFLSMPCVSVTGETYAIINQKKDGKGVAGISTEGIGEYVGSIMTGYTSGNVTTILGRDGKAYEWINTGDNVYVCDAKTNAAKLHCLDDENEVTVDGWILGAAQKDAAEGICFFGMDRERKPAMWDKGGNKLQVAFPNDLSAPEYYVVYEKNGSMLVCDKYALWESEGEGYKCLFSFMGITR